MFMRIWQMLCKAVRSAGAFACKIGKALISSVRRDAPKVAETLVSTVECVATTVAYVARRIPWGRGGRFLLDLIEKTPWLEATGVWVSTQIAVNAPAIAEAIVPWGFVAIATNTIGVVALISAGLFLIAAALHLVRENLRYRREPHDGAMIWAQ